MLDVVLQVAHEHKISGLVPAAVQGVVVDVAQDGAGSDAVRPVLGVDELAEAVHHNSAVLALTFLLVLLGLRGGRKINAQVGTHNHGVLPLYTIPAPIQTV